MFPTMTRRDSTILITKAISKKRYPSVQLKFIYRGERKKRKEKKKVISDLHNFLAWKIMSFKKINVQRILLMYN